MKLFKHNKPVVEPVDPNATLVEPLKSAAEPTNGAPAATTTTEPTPPTGVSPAQPPVSTQDRFDRMFDDWMLLPFRPTDAIEFDHLRNAESLVVRVALPGIDPDQDVELTVSDGVLWLDGQHREEERTEDHGHVTHAMWCGAFSRSFPLPDGVTANEIRATYQDGVLEIRIPTPTSRPAATVPITKQ